jgi:hypothetical protein
MLMVISPAKSLDLTPVEDAPSSPRLFARDTASLARVTRRLKHADLKQLMDISDDLAALNVRRFKAFDAKSHDGVQAAFAFNGEVYSGLQARSLGPDGLAYAQERLRILSGFYGLLRPLDRIQPYRLEMGVGLANKRGPTLYAFWGARIAKALNAEAKTLDDPTLVNLASQEYFRAVDRKALKLPVVTCQFKEEKGNELRMLGVFAKKARGLMARWAADHRVERAEQLKDFDAAGYGFRSDLSTPTEWVFARPQP